MTEIEQQSVLAIRQELFPEPHKRLYLLWTFHFESFVHEDDANVYWTSPAGLPDEEEDAEIFDDPGGYTTEKAYEHCLGMLDKVYVLGAVKGQESCQETLQDLVIRYRYLVEHGEDSHPYGTLWDTQVEWAKASLFPNLSPQAREIIGDPTP